MTIENSLESTPVLIHSAVPTFLVSDVAATARWYAEHLAFETVGNFPDDEPYAYASLQRGLAEIMLLALAGYEKPDLRARRPSGLWDAYIRTDGVYSLYQSLEGQPFIELPLKLQPYGNWEFEVRDPNGYMLVFGGSY
jgi:catechol 2,3-dioxygenase-like lactoylglutathione lyase family enzyme